MFTLLIFSVGSGMSQSVEQSFVFERPIFDGLGTQKAIGLKPTENGFWNDAERLPYFSFVIPSKSNKINILNSSYESRVISEAEKEDLYLDRVTSELKLNTYHIRDRSDSYIKVEGPLVIFNNDLNQYELITEIKLDYQLFNKSKLKEKSFVNSSVLADGNGVFYKLGITKTGVYKIDYNYLSELGIDVDNLNPNSVNIYGNGNGMLSYDNSVPRDDDLLKNAILVEGDSDGEFDQADYILFYAYGPHTVKKGTDDFYIHEANNFTDTSYYYLNINTAGVPKRMTNSSLTSAPANISVNTYNDYEFIEPDDRNLVKSGQEWYGDIYDVQLNYDYNFELSQVSTTEQSRVTLAAVVSTNAPYSVADSVKFLANFQGKSLRLSSPAPSGQGYLAPVGKWLSSNLNFIPNSSGDVNVQLTFDKFNYPASKGYLDYIGLNVIRNLYLDRAQTTFAKINTVGVGNVVEFNLSNTSDLKYLWEITDKDNVKIVPYTPGVNVNFSVQMDSLRTFAAITDGQLYVPSFMGEVATQNLHGLDQADMIIITAPKFKNPANELAQFHRDRGLSVHVVFQNQVFNEFSSGMRDPVAIRHFLKMFYDRANGVSSLEPKYCLLMGDCSYDYKNKLNSNSDYVITFESEESLKSISTYATDDFYGILDDNASMQSSDLMNVAVGRLPVETEQEAFDIVNKIKYYNSNVSSETGQSCTINGEESVYKDWRNVICQVSDDGDNNAYFIDVEIMANKMENDHPDFDIVKVHSDAYIETVTASGQKNFGARDAIESRVNRGALLVNYIGHGGEVGWAHEEILNVNTIQSWNNLNTLPLFMTATCEFSRYDDHDRVSAGEYVVLNPDGGGVALLTTTRLVFSSSNEALTRYFYDTVVDLRNGEPQTMGEICKATKNKFAIYYGGNDFRKFTLLGDPSLPLAVPYHDMVIDSINGVPLSLFTDTITALSKVSFSGHVEDYLGNKLTNYEGVVSPTCFDKISELKTLGNSSDSYEADFQMWKNKVFNGNASVKNGEFSFEFVVPKDINLQVADSRISLYGTDNESDGNGYAEGFLLGGINKNAPEDNQGPDVQLYLNTENFVTGGITDANPVLIAKLFDENGLNTVGSGVGHNIEFRLDGNEPISLNDFYEGDLDTYQSGQVTYGLSDLEAGDHKLSFKAWDVYNNSADAELEFTVIEEENLSLEHLLNYPNPFTTSTEFSFEHNQVCDYLDVQIQIFTVSGLQVKDIQRRITSDGFRVSGIQWDGRDDYGDKLGIGTYIYKCTVQTENGKSIEKFERLVVLR